MPLNAATRTEPDVLHEGALTTAALDRAVRAEAPAVLAGRPAGRGGGSAPHHKTGVGGTVRPAEKDDSTTKALVALLDKSLSATNNIWKRYATSKGRDDADLDKAVADSIEALVKAEGVKLVEELPFGKVIMTSFELSIAFADGVGQALEKVNAELEKSYDFSRLGPEVDEETKAVIQSMRGYQAEATRRLPQVLAEGLKQVAGKATDMLLEKVGEIPGKILEDVAGQIAGQLVKQNDLLAIFREGVEEASRSIPAGRAKVERLAFRFVAKAYLDQMENPDLQKRLADLPNVATSDKPVDVALLGTIVKMLAQNGYDTYQRHVPVEYAATELKQMLIETAQDLAKALVNRGVTVESSGSSEVVVEKDRLKVPASWVAHLNQSPDRAAAMRELWRSRMWEFHDYCQRLKTGLEIRRLGYRKQYLRMTRRNGPDRELWGRIQNQWADDWSDARKQALEAIDVIVDQVGEGWDSGYDHRGLEQGYNTAIAPLADPRWDYRRAPDFMPFTW